jgi:CotH kinase protein/Lamin Tail Domain/Secretion system C-terminal sorting domain/Chitobiase/beta-hexosaminidase C-terminal domain/Divergent InlB B-repeat domain
MNRLLFLIFFFSTALLNAQLKINEVCYTNATVKYDEDSTSSDFIEIYNAGASPIDLKDYYLTDDAFNKKKWAFGNKIINPSSHYVVYASGKDRPFFIHHWEAVINSNSTWKYDQATATSDTNWKKSNFVDAAWLSGTGGFGNADGDDNTVITPQHALYIRKAFTITDTSKIVRALLHADYDDGFVAYINGVEVARSETMLSVPYPIMYNQLANFEHKSKSNLSNDSNSRESFYINKALLKKILVNGTNYLCIEIHNRTVSGSMSSNFNLSFGLIDAGSQFGPLPTWFDAKPAPYMHTNFKLSENENIYLISRITGAIEDNILLNSADQNHSIARIPDGSMNQCFMSNPTPGASNNSSICYIGYEPTPFFVLPAGIYNSNQNISLLNLSPTGLIRYTLNGSKPKPSSTIYTGIINLANTKVISAITYSTVFNKLPSKVAKSTYIVNEPSFGRAKVVSVTIDSLELYDPITGLFMWGPDITLDVNGNPNATHPFPMYSANYWKDWKREGYVEFFDKQGIQQFETPIQLKVHGGWSRAFGGSGNGQKSLRIFADGDIGLDAFNYPIIDDKPEVQKYLSFNLRNGGSAGYGRLKCREAIMQRTMKGTNTPYIAQDVAVVFLNGKYYGFYELREHENAGFLENNYGVKEDDLDLLGNSYQVLRTPAGVETYKWDYLNELQGDSKFFFDVVGFVGNRSPLAPNFFNEVSNVIDIENVIDYLVAETYFANPDWLGYGNNSIITKNMKFWKPKSLSSKLRFNFMDMDAGCGLVFNSAYNYLSVVATHQSRVGKIFSALMQNTEFNKRFINRYADLINTVFQPYNFNAIANSKLDSMQGLFPRDMQRWGSSYATAVNDKNIMIAYNTQRVDSARKVIRNYYALTKNVQVTLNVNPVGAGKIVISTLTIPSDSMPWKGIYFDGNPVRITAIPNPGYSFVNWNANAQTFNVNDQSIELNINANSTFTANFTGTAMPANILVSEINYNPHPKIDGGEWIELKNKTNAAIYMHQWKLRDESKYTAYKFPLLSKIPANSYAIVCQDSARFKTKYPNYTGQIFGNVDYVLSNKADALYLENSQAQTVAQINYVDSIWSSGADGQGYTLELINDNLPLNTEASWTDACLGGSPGASPGPCNYPIVVSEINYNSPFLSNAGDWLELRNTTSAPINLSNWYISNKDEDKKVSISSNTILAPHSHTVIVKDSNLFRQRFPTVKILPIELPFSLSNGGDQFKVFAYDSSLKYSVRYNDVAPYPIDADGNGYTLELSDTTGYMYRANVWTIGCEEGSPSTYFDSACGVSAQDILITEINYDVHSALNSGNWFEVHNNSAKTVNLKNWKFKKKNTNTVFTVPNDYSIWPNQRLVFTTDTNAFKSIFPTNTSYYNAQLNFALDNNGDGISIINYKGKLISKVAYDEVAPWTLLAAGRGYTLERQAGINNGNTASDWFGGCLGGSPGLPFSVCTSPLIISEINFNSNGAASDMGDWLEIMNTESFPVSLNGWKISNDAEINYFNFPNGVTLQPNQRIVIRRDSSKFDHQILMPLSNLNILPELLNFDLGNATDGIRLYKSLNGNRLAYSMLYETNGTWPNANSNGKTYELSTSNANPSEGSSWFAGCLRGSPSLPYDPNCLQLSISKPSDNSILQFDLYPNPANDFFQIQVNTNFNASNASIEIYDGLGRKVRTIGNQRILSELISTATWSEGNYFMLLKSDNKIVQKVLIVKH